MQPCLSCVADYLETKTLSNNEKQLKNEEMNKTREIQENSDEADQVIHGDFYLIERIWKGALQKAQLGKKLKVIPTVHAAKEEPQRNILRIIEQDNVDLYIIERIWKNALPKAQLGANFKVEHATKPPKSTHQALNRDLDIIKRLWNALQKAISRKPEVYAVKQPQYLQRNTPKGIDQNNIDQVFNRDLYIIERIWENALQKVQLGANVKVLHATKRPKATDLNGDIMKRLWKALQKVLSGKNFKIIPEVHAIRQPEGPQRNTPKATHQNNLDLYIIGRIWIRALKKALLGANLNVVPVVHAAKQPEAPQKPPKMKYTDLPIYQSPHYEYKEYLEDKDRCPERNTKLLQKYLLPYTKKYRKVAQENLCQAKCIVNKYCVNTCTCVKKAKNDFKATMRDPDNLTVRQAVVGVGTLTGYLLGGGGGLPRRFFFTSIGFLTTGALCFPKETDEVFRSFTYMVGKAVISMYNIACSKNADLRERLTCKEDLPSQPPQRKTLQCPSKK